MGNPTVDYLIQRIKGLRISKEGAGAVGIGGAMTVIEFARYSYRNAFSRPSITTGPTQSLTTSIVTQARALADSGDVAGNGNLVSPTQIYGHTGNQLWVKLGGTSALKQNVDSADEAVDMGSLWAIRQTKDDGFLMAA